MNLKQKIRNTTLFDNFQKINILVDIDNINKEDKLKLELLIDDFDKSMSSLAQQFKTELKGELDEIERASTKIKNHAVTKSIVKIKQGLDVIIPNGDSK